MKCSKCNAEIPENSWVCPECGTAVERQSEPEPKPENGPEKKSKKAWIIGGAAAAVITAAAVGIGFFAANKDPKTVVIEALQGVYAAENTDPAEEVFGFKQLFKNIKTTGSEMGIELAFADSSEPDFSIFQGAGITIDTASDPVNKKFSEKLGIIYSGMDLATIDIYGDDTYIMASVPELTSKVLTINYADNLSEQIANSPLMQESGITLTEEDKQAIENYAAYLSSIYSGEKQPFDVKALLQRYKEGSQAMGNLKEALTVTKAENSRLMYNGKEQTCTGYDVIIPKEALIEFLRTTSRFFMEDEGLKGDLLEYIKVVLEMSRMSYAAADDEMDLPAPEELLSEFWTELDTGFEDIITDLERILDGNITMKVYVTKKGQLAAMDVSCAFADSGSTLVMTAKAVLEGGSYPTQNGSLTVAMTENEDTITCNFTKSGEYTDAALNSGWKFQIEYAGETVCAEYENAYDRTTNDSAIRISFGDGSEESGVDITLDGVVDLLEKGKNIHYTLDSLTVEDASGLMFFELDGALYLRELQTEIMVPEGEQMDVLAASGQDWEELINEVVMSVYSMILGGSFLQ